MTGTVSPNTKNATTTETTMIPANVFLLIGFMPQKFSHFLARLDLRLLSNPTRTDGSNSAEKRLAS